MFIGIIGHMGHGKTTMVGRYLTEQGFTRIHPATPIRQVLIPFLEAFGITDPALHHRLLEGDLKRSPLPIPGLQHLTPTSLQQSLGTAWGREEVHPEVWNLIVKRQLAEQPKAYNDSIRFPNECAMVTEASGYLIKVTRPDQPLDLGHVSEQHVATLPYHFEVINDGDYLRVARQMAHILEQTHRYPYEEFQLNNPTAET